MPQKLAIVISGAVSLGSYEAGVMYEVINAIKQHNDATSSDDEKITIDVLTGASAGAMTACILAQKLLFDADALQGEYSNALFKAWVKEVDITKLLDIQGNDNPFHSILSSHIIQQISHHHLLERYDRNNIPPINTHNAAADEIYLGISMSNLNGFDFEYSVTDYRQLSNLGQSVFVYTKHQDRFTKKLGKSSDKLNVWEEIEKAGRSSGAFPFAFQAMEIKRNPTDEAYEGARKFNLSNPGQPIPFCYTDGGVFENEPLGLAKRLVNQIDLNPKDYENRFYLYIAPGIKKSSINFNFNAENANYFNTLKALGGAIFTQARFRDWIKTNQINKNIKRFDQQADMLKTVITQSPELSSCFNTVATNLLDILYRTDTRYEPNTEANNPITNIPNTHRGELDSVDNTYLREQFDAEYTSIQNQHGTSVADSWLKTVQVLEKAASLGNRDIMKIYSITSDDTKIVGEGLSAFAGFFDERFRKFDYDIGRQTALDSLNALKQHLTSAQRQGEIRLTNFVGSQPPQLDQKLINIAKQNSSLALLKISLDTYLIKLPVIILFLLPVKLCWFLVKRVFGSAIATINKKP